MARYLGASCRLCRAEGEKLFLKGTRCVTDKCALARRAYGPGQHGKAGLKRSNYGLQLREKQKVKRMYGILERQFRRYFSIAARTKGVTGEMLLQLLERRLDNVVFRSGFALSRSQARQFVRHGMISVNNKRVTIPSYAVGRDEVLTVSNKERVRKLLKSIVEATKDRPLPEWLKVSPENLTSTVARLPERSDIAVPIKEQLIVELYSK